MRISELRKDTLQLRIGDVAPFIARPEPGVIKNTKALLLILKLDVIRRLELKPNSEQKVEHIFAAQPYCQAVHAFRREVIESVSPPFCI